MSHNLKEYIRALRLINSSGRRGLTHAGNVLISRLAPGLLAAGLIRYASSRYSGYALTKSGMERM